MMRLIELVFQKATHENTIGHENVQAKESIARSLDPNLQMRQRIQQPRSSRELVVIDGFWNNRAN
jgi:hypothetical protein